MAATTIRTNPDATEANLMMDHMTGGMMLGMGLIGILVLLLLILGIAALVKYLFFSASRPPGNGR
jgi:hypothetical protein